MTLTGFADTRKIIRCYSPDRDSYGVLAANKNELAAQGCWCWCCELAKRAFKTGGGASWVLAPLPRAVEVP